jgi:hypothetical protein
MDTNIVLIMFAVIAAFGLATATLVVPIVPQAHAQGCTAQSSACSGFGLAQRDQHLPTDLPSQAEFGLAQRDQHLP